MGAYTARSAAARLTGRHRFNMLVAEPMSDLNSRFVNGDPEALRENLVGSGTGRGDILDLKMIDLG